jgi:hypothetical protein
MSEKSMLISARRKAKTIKLFIDADKIRDPNRESPFPHTEPTPSLYPFPAVGEKDIPGSYAISARVSPRNSPESGQTGHGDAVESN